LELKLENGIKEINKIRIRKQNIQDVENFSKNVKISFMLILGYLFFVLLCSFMCLSLVNDLSRSVSGNCAKQTILYLLYAGLVFLAFGCITCLREVGSKNN